MGRNSDLPPGVSQFDEHINPSGKEIIWDEESNKYLCPACGHEVKSHGTEGFDSSGRYFDIGWNACTNCDWHDEP